MGPDGVDASRRSPPSVVSAQVAVLAIEALRAAMEWKSGVAPDLVHLDRSGETAARLEHGLDRLVLLLQSFDRKIGDLVRQIFPAEQQPASEVECRHVVIQPWQATGLDGAPPVPLLLEIT